MKRGFALAALTGCAFIWASTTMVRGQNGPVKSATDFSSVDYCDPPNQMQMKERFSGAEGQPVSDSLMLVKRMKLEIFTNGIPQYTIAAPECLYDRDKDTANSSGPISIQQADGRWLLTGEGFSWVHGTNEDFLVISNNVHTVMTAAPNTKMKP